MGYVRVCVCVPRLSVVFLFVCAWLLLLCLVFVYRGEVCVRFPAVRVVVVLAVFDVGVYDVGGVVAALVRGGGVVLFVCAVAAVFIGFRGKERRRCRVWGLWWVCGRRGPCWWG